MEIDNFHKMDKEQVHPDHNTLTLGLASLSNNQEIGNRNNVIKISRRDQNRITIFYENSDLTFPIYGHAFPYYLESKRRPIPNLFPERNMTLKKSDCNVFQVSEYFGGPESVILLLDEGKVPASVLEASILRKLSSVVTPNSDSLEDGLIDRHNGFRYLGMNFVKITVDTNVKLVNANKRCHPENFEEAQIVIAPQLCIDHYYLLEIDCVNLKVHIWDSYVGHLEKNYKGVRRLQIRKVLEGLFLQVCVFSRDIIQIGDKKWKLVHEKKCFQQIGTTECGLYVYYFARNILKGERHKNFRESINLTKIRKNIAYNILNTCENGREFLTLLTV